MNRYICGFLLMIPLTMAGCGADDTAEILEETEKPFRIETRILPFEGEGAGTRSADLTKFETGDRMLLKIICPFSPTTEYGETTHGNSVDGIWLQKWSASGWTALTAAADKCDIDGDYNYSGSSSLTGQFDAQQTPYVFTSSTWSQEKRFRTKDNKVILQYAHVFHADQSRAENYRASDLLWAQSIMQTGTDYITLTYAHKMASLVVTINGTISENAVLTIENMPDIDQQEVIVGNYYAPVAKALSGNNYGYKKCSCLYEYNGKVIGITVNDETNNCVFVRPMTGNPNPAYQTNYTADKLVKNTGTYTAFREYTDSGDNKTYFKFIVPPCSLIQDSEGKGLPVLVLRDGAKRYSYMLKMSQDEGSETWKTVFTEGTQYSITLNLPS